MTAELVFLAFLYIVLFASAFSNASLQMRLPQWYHLSPEERILLTLAAVMSLMIVVYALVTNKKAANTSRVGRNFTAKGKRLLTDDDLSVHSWVTKDLDFD